MKLESIASRHLSRQDRRRSGLTGPQRYVRQWLFGLFLKVLRLFAYPWGAGKGHLNLRSHETHAMMQSSFTRECPRGRFNNFLCPVFSSFRAPQISCCTSDDLGSCSKLRKEPVATNILTICSSWNHRRLILHGTIEDSCWNNPVILGEAAYST